MMRGWVGIPLMNKYIKQDLSDDAACVEMLLINLID
jgi:hypothetical protein